MNTLSSPHTPTGSEPARDDDPTGVRALLSALPQPDAMPEHLVERINASLAAEQAQRARTVSSASLTPLRAGDSLRRLRRTRLRLVLGSVAAAIAIVAVVGTSLFTARQTSTNSTTASASNPSEAGALAAQAPPNAAGKAQGPDLSSSTTPGATDKGLNRPGVSAAPPITEIRNSGTRYTAAGFVTQAEVLLRSTPGPSQPRLEQSPAFGRAATTSGLTECLNALGAGGAQVVRADVATYQGQPALIVVATTNGASVAYPVGRQCSRADPAVLRPATPLS